MEIQSIETNDISEIWMTIKDYENYEISNLGRLRNVKTRRIINGNINMYGYIVCYLRKNGKTKDFRVHRLVASHFIDNPENKREVNHLGKKTDNRSCMLEWATPLENNQHANKFIIKRFKRKINLLCPKTKVVLKAFDTYRQANVACKYNLHKLLGQNVPYNGYLWEYAVKKEPPKIIDGEIWVCLKDSIHPNISKFKKYYVSNFGRVKGHKGQLMTLSKSIGFQSLQLNNNGSYSTVRVHRLVLMAFNIPNPQNKKEVDHINSDPFDNRLINLRWADKIDQANNECTKLKLRKPRERSKMTINVTYPNGTVLTHRGLADLAKTLHMSRNTINDCSKTGKYHKNHKFEIITKI